MLKQLVVTSVLLLPVLAAADPLPPPDPCSVARQKKKGETCVACTGGGEPCKKAHATDGFELRCSRGSGDEVWCKPAAPTRK